jgi:hypothetical protein
MNSNWFKKRLETWSFRNSVEEIKNGIGKQADYITGQKLGQINYVNFMSK